MQMLNYGSACDKFIFTANLVQTILFCNLYIYTFVMEEEVKSYGDFIVKKAYVTIYNYHTSVAGIRLQIRPQDVNRELMLSL